MTFYFDGRISLKSVQTTLNLLEYQHILVYLRKCEYVFEDWRRWFYSSFCDMQKCSPSPHYIMSLIFVMSMQKESISSTTSYAGFIYLASQSSVSQKLYTIYENDVFCCLMFVTHDMDILNGCFYLYQKSEHLLWHVAFMPLMLFYCSYSSPVG